MGLPEPSWTLAVCEIVQSPNFDAPLISGTDVQVYGMLGSILSFENVATEIATRCTRDFSAVSLHDYRRGSPPAPANLQDRLYINPEAPVALFHGIAYAELPQVLKSHRYRIGLLVCDADIVSAEAIETCNRSFDLVVVPSQFCRSTFEKSGLRCPVMIVPHGLSPAFTALESGKTGDDRPNRPFTFYNVYSQSRRFRKSEEELITAFIKAFDRDPAYRLKLRTAHSDSLDRLIVRQQGENVIRVHGDNLDEERYAEMFTTVDATVHPSKAEGFGMVPLQSLACATAVIAPHTTGMKDYLTRDNSMALRTSGRVDAKGDEGLKAGGQYHSIDQDHLVQCLQEMVESNAAWKTRAADAAASIRRQYSWERVSAPLMDCIRTELNRN